MAQTLEDVLARRIRGLFLNSEETLRIADQVIGIMTKELKKDTDWKQSQLNQFETLCKNYKL